MNPIAKQQPRKFNLLVGTYTNTCPSIGIYVYEFDSDSGELKLKNNCHQSINPSYLSVSSDTKFVYAVNENETESTVSSFTYNTKSGRLSLLNKNDSVGSSPCYLINDEQNIIVANYLGGCITVFKKVSNGSISKVQQVIQHEGKGIHKNRQDKAHAHMVYFSPDKKFVLCNDLGIDKVFIYAYDPTSKDEILTLKETIDVKAGSGPRHSVFGKNGKFMYLIHELDETLTTFSYDQTGSLKLIRETNITPENHKKANSAAAIKISPDGNFLYTTDRGEANLISTFKILTDGSLELLEQVATQGENPRDFAIDPLGNYLLIANQDTDNITVFKRNKITGKITYINQSIEICTPACLCFTAL
jgi:6-phosphogluconolactonase